MTTTVYDSSGLAPRQRRQLDEIQELAEELARKELEVARVRRRLERALLEAYDAEIRPRAIIDAAGITKQRMHQILKKLREEGVQ